MEIEDFLTRHRWAIIRELARGEKSASEIAKKTNQSLANTSIQMKIMEAYNIIKKAKPEQELERRKAGKPRIPYALSQELFVAGLMRQGLAEKKVIKIKEADDFHKVIFTSIFTLNNEDQYYLLKFIFITDMLDKADALAFLHSNEKEFEVFILSDNCLHELREKHSSTIVHKDDKSKRIISWTHNKQEFEEGVRQGEEYFLNLLNNSKVLFDKKGTIEGLRKHS